MVLKNLIATWISQKISEYPYIFASTIMEKNKDTFVEMGLSDKDIYAINKQMKTQFHYWTKYEMSIQKDREENPDIAFTDNDRDFIMSMVGPEILRIPLNIVNIEQDGSFNMYKRKEKCTLLAIEAYRYGDFGPELIQYDETNPDMKDLISEFLEDEDVHAWGYIRFLHDQKKPKEKRAF